MRAAPEVYNLVHRDTGAVMYQLYVAPEMVPVVPVVPDWITASIEDYDHRDYEWLNPSTGERTPAQPIRRWVYLPPDDLSLYLDQARVREKPASPPETSDQSKLRGPGSTRGQRRGFVGVRLSGEERTVAQAVADAEHGGNLSEAIRALLAEAVAQRQRREPPPSR